MRKGRWSWGIHRQFAHARGICGVWVKEPRGLVWLKGCSVRDTHQPPIQPYVKKINPQALTSIEVKWI